MFSGNRCGDYMFHRNNFGGDRILLRAERWDRSVDGVKQHNISREH